LSSCGNYLAIYAINLNSYDSASVLLDAKTKNNNIYKGILLLILNDEHIKFSAHNNKLIVDGTMENFDDLVELLLVFGVVDPSVKDNAVFIEYCRRGELSIIKFKGQ
jgi:hypothetical protein